jgi:Ca2+-binding RTX toxin-like protein
MAVVTFRSDMRPGLRLRDFFTAAAGTVTYKSDGEQETATFKIEVDKTILDVVYSGPTISEEGGQVSYLEFQRDGVPWLTYGSLGGPILFAYADALSAFQAQGAGAAAAIMQGNDQLIGSSRSDHLEGYAGNDLLDGGAGGDTLDGGSGNDTYIVDNWDDRVFEAAGGGYDVVCTGVSFAMAADVEIEELRAAAGARSLSLFGSDTSNLIVGTSGNDEIDGKGGVDTMIGGARDDLYIVDNPFDVIQEDIGQGRDTVIASTSYTLGANIETLKASGGYASINLAGNAQSNEIVGNAGANVIYGLDGDDRLYGDGGNDIIYGGSGQDILYGGLGNNSLSGESGDDLLYGGDGKDTLDGGAGHDRLYGGNGSNKLLGQSGNDTLYGGMHADSLQGGDGNDRLYGDVGNDTLDGGAGKDTLSGGWGRDTFIFKNKLNAKTNVDTITDFNVKDDTIRLENSIFKKLGKAGKLNPDFFTVGSKAQDGNDYLIYNKKNGYLSYDADGAGSKYKPVLFAKLKSGLALTEKDFYII